jgi:Concanavalin A-like lectin/glucanases superfamily
MGVAIRCVVAALVAMSGCRESLFDANGGGQPGGDRDGSVSESCPATCIADAAAAFDGSVDGADDRWRYVNDRRNRSWTAMTPVSGGMAGDAENRIERCRDKPSAAACNTRDALLVTSSGNSSTSDPAIEYTSADARVVQLTLRVNVPASGSEQRVRLYRNSREDVLFTQLAAPGAPVAHALTLDALPGDRFVVAIEPIAQGGTAAVQLFVNDVGKAFPSTCQLAVGFADADVVNAAVDDLCGGAMTSILNMTPMTPVLADGPFPQHGMGAYLEPGFFLSETRALPGGDATFQLWAQPQLSADQRGVVFSDIDEITGRGHRIQLVLSLGLQLEAAVVGGTSPVTYTSQRVDLATPNTNRWYFLRVVHAGGTVSFCVDGARVMSLPLPATSGAGGSPHLGRNGPWFPQNELTGVIDDVRVFSTALPCE